MFELVRLSVSGFRGFVGTQEFEFDRPVALLFGENHQGKSSTLNAVEWCLFGEDCVGKKTGIRERVGWEVASRSLREGNVSVVTEFQDPKGRYVVTREQHVGRRRGGEDLAILTPEGTRVHGDEAKMLLYALFRSSFQDFMTTVYQHQEAVRAVLTQEPRERNAAIDRLLGLSTYREVLDGITAANLERAVSEMEHRREDFRSRCEQTVRTLDNLIAKERGKAVSAGIGEEELSEAGALSRARHIGDAVRSLAQELGAGDFRTTVPESVGEVEAFRDWVKRQTDYLWGQAPDVVNQETLFAEQTRLLNVKQHCEGAIADETARKATRDDFVREFGDEETLVNTADELRRSAKQAEHEMRETEAKANLVWEAIQYLRGIAPTASTRRCPLCGADAPDLLSHLEAEWEETIRVRVEEVIQARDRVKARLSKVESLTAECRRLEQGLQEASGRRKIAVDQVGEALRIEIGAEDDPLALASTRLQEIDEELQLANQAIKEKRERISGIYGELSELRLIDEILSLERRKEVVERIWGTREFREMEQAIDEACELLEDARAIRSCLAEVSREEAGERVDMATAGVNKYFCWIAKQPAIPGLAVEVAEDRRTGLNSYDFKSKDGSDPTPVLSQGDLNCLALSLFLGLSDAMAETQPFAFLMLDDPTQSLGSEMKRELVRALNDIATRRRLIIATMDAEFKDLLVDGIAKSKAIYSFVDWTADHGPQVMRTA